MYCVQCGVRLADTEQTCPLCGTRAYHPDLPREKGNLLYPQNREPKLRGRSKAQNGALIILFLIPMIVCFFADRQLDGEVTWCGYVAGALLLAYVVVALPFWFRRPNPVIFVPCDFAAVALYLLYVDLATENGWFLDFALPVVGAFALLTCTVVTLLHYLKRGKLYIFGGAFIALGGIGVLMELLMVPTFGLPYIGWSMYPLTTFVLFGGMLIYLAINRSAREAMERKLFF